MNLTAESISALGERTFMVGEGRASSYADLAREIARARSDLAGQGIGPGQVVALTGHYNFRAASLFLALVLNRNVVVPLVGTESPDVSRRMAEAGAEHCLRIGKGTVELRTLPSQGPHPLVQRLQQDSRAGLILFSSGTAGKPKGMVHDLDTLIGTYRTRQVPPCRVLAFMGIDHIGGIDIFLRAVANGATLVVPPDRSPETICRLIESERVEVLPATPSFLNLMLLSGAHRNRDLSALRIIGFGAERMPESVLERLKEVFPNADLQQKFGTSETNAMRTRSKASGSLWMRIDDPDVEWRVVEGELWLKTPSRIIGYLNHGSDRLLADGWYRTGDLVEEDGEGFFRILGRRESMINVGGEKVVPQEVEAVVGEVPGVLDCRVFGEANPILGQTVSVEVVIAAGADARQLTRQIRRHCRQRLAPYKVPVKIAVVNQIAVTERFKRKA